MIRVKSKHGMVYEIGCDVEKTEDSCTFRFNYDMECVCKEAPDGIDRREDAKMMAQTCEMLYLSEGFMRCFSVMPPGAAEYELMELLKENDYEVESFIEEDDSPMYDENGRNIVY